jgi:hypothetical protein
MASSYNDNASLLALQARVEQLEKTVEAFGRSQRSAYVPLRASAPAFEKQPYRGPSGYVQPQYKQRDVRDGRDARMANRVERERVPVSDVKIQLSQLLKDGEEVTIQISTGKAEDGSYVYTSVCATYQDGKLTVSKSELTPSLVGLVSEKPGEILYKFMDELKKLDHIKKTYNVAPWKCSSVVRDGKRLTLSELANFA